MKDKSKGRTKARGISIRALHGRGGEVGRKETENDRTVVGQSQPNVVTTQKGVGQQGRKANQGLRRKNSQQQVKNADRVFAKRPIGDGIEGEREKNWGKQ